MGARPARPGRAKRQHDHRGARHVRFPDARTAGIDRQTHRGVIGNFLAGFGKEGLGDAVFVEKTDHDAGHKPGNENWLWDSTAYARYFLWTRTIAHRTGPPICGWQMSEGNLSIEPKWRDDAAETYLAHPRWWIDGGFAGSLFGAGNGDCVNYLNDSDNGWFVARMSAAAATPIALPAVGILPRRMRVTGPRGTSAPFGRWDMRDLLGRLLEPRRDSPPPPFPRQEPIPTGR